MNRLWKEGTIGIPVKGGKTKIAHYWAKVYDEGSEYGINEGRISKLRITIDGETVVNYDRGWDVQTVDEDTQLAYEILVHTENF